MKTVFLTGANKGIGYELTSKLLLEGYKVIALSKSINNLEEITNENLLVFKVDLLDSNKLTKILKEIKEKDIHIDILINNVGKGIFKKIEEFSFDEWNEIIQLNLTIPFLLMNNFIPEMKSRKFGRIINIGSDADYIPYPEAGVYCASKYGLRGLTESIRLDLKKSNINITTVSPGRVDTYFNGKYPGCRPNALKVEDVSNQILFVLGQNDRCNVEQIRLTSSLE